jgi:hypothetical protein
MSEILPKKVNLLRPHHVQQNPPVYAFIRGNDAKGRECIDCDE